ncbi:hypothetical protein ABZ619_39095 [Streptomyces sp. NPDC007851]|uniref:hypothetical protein n=1 Tax=Streptomyces sp. NPDC007851 TaxID=3155008 RepID=UPI00340EBE40
MPDTPKPPLPAGMFDEWPRIVVDTSRGTPHHRIARLATHAADHWALGPDGPLKTPQPLASTISGAVHEALLHLAELGLIDIDTDRLNAAKAIPIDRGGLGPKAAVPEHLSAGANAENCPACKGTNPPYPFLCPGPTKDTTHG